MKSFARSFKELFLQATGLILLAGLIFFIGFPPRAGAVQYVVGDTDTLSANPISQSSIGTTWTESIVGSTEDLYRCVGIPCTPALYVSGLAGGAGSSGYTDTTLSAGTTYQYKTCAGGSCTNVGTATTDAPTPGVPSGLSASAASRTQINLSWTRNSPFNESGFGLQSCAGAACTNFVNLPNPPAGATSASDTGLTCGTTYRYKVYSYVVTNGRAYYSAESNIASASTNSCDTTPPVCGSWSPSSGPWHNTSTGTSFTLSGSTDEVGGSGINVAGGSCTTGTTNGATCPVSISDNAGNITACTSPTNNIDTTAPVCGSWSPSSGPWHNTSTGTSFTLSGSTDALSGINVAGGSCTTGTTNGATCSVSISDNASNSASCASPANNIDQVLPASSDNWTDSWTSSSPVSVTLSASDTGGSGVSGINWCVDGLNTCTPASSGSSYGGSSGATSNMGYPSNFACTSGSGCTQYFRYLALDNAGNSESPVRSNRVRQDRQPPVASSISGSATSQSQIDWTLSGFSDALSGSNSGGSYGFSVNSGATYGWQVGAIFSQTSLTCGNSYTVYGKERDAVGNETAAVSNSVSTQACVYAPSAPSSGTASPDSGRPQATVSWSGAANGYQIWRYLTSAASSTRTLVGTTASNSYQPSSLYCPANHKFEIVAYNTDSSVGGIDPSCALWSISGAKCSFSTVTSKIDFCTKPFLTF